MTQPDWEALRTFSLVAQSGSMARAANELGCAVSTIARRIDGLEQALDLVLLHRARGGAVPTAAGEAILGSIARAAQSLDQIPRQAKHFQRFKDRRPVRLSATETVINDVMLPRIDVLRARYPELLIELESTNAIASLEFGKTDLAIRLAEPTQKELITRALPPITMELFVSRAQLAGRDPAAVSLAEEPLVWIDAGLGDIAENRLIDALGIGEQIVMRATSVRALALACAAGQGAAMLPSYMGAAFDLVPLPAVALPSRRAWLVYHAETRRDPVMRNIRKWVVESFEAVVRG